MSAVNGRLEDDEAGAVAIMVAVLALVLVMVAALSVDLGNAWARGRIVQKQADVSAIGAGSLLPMSTSDARTDNEPADIADRAMELLNQNQAAGQADAVAANLLDADLTNGHLEFLNAAGVACADNCVRLRLTPPQATVDFALAGAVASGVDVVRSATVEVFSEIPPMQKVIPLWLPSGCGYGAVHGDTAQGPASPTTSPTPTASGSPSPSASASGSPSGSPSPSPSAGTVTISPRGTHTIAGTSPVAVAAGSTKNILNYQIAGLPANVDRASIRLVAPDSSYYIEYAVASSVPHGTMVVPPFEIGTEISNVPGDWTSYAVIQEKGNDKPLQYSSNNLVVRVTGTPPPSPSPTGPSTSASPSASASDVPVGCAGQDRGNFGQMDSPRRDAGGSGQNTRLAWNLAFGLDHLIVPFGTTTDKECAKSNGSNAIAGAQLDNESRDGNNCVIGDTGNDGPALFDGLIAGVNGQQGRLDASLPGHNCTGRTRAVGSHVINDDLLSCYLTTGVSLDDIAQATGVDDTMLDPAIKESPRFVWLPMVLATDRAQKGYQPIVDFVPAFVTNETQTTDATADNGLQINGNSVKAIQLFAFNKAALPVGEQSPTIGYSTVLDRPIVRLVG